MGKLVVFGAVLRGLDKATVDETVHESAADSDTRLPLESSPAEISVHRNL